SEPITWASGLRRETSRAFSRASATAISGGVAPCPVSSVSICRSSMSAASVVKSSLAPDINAFRDALLEARISLVAMVVLRFERRLSLFHAESKDGCRGLLDRFAGDVDHRPVMAGTE